MSGADTSAARPRGRCCRPSWRPRLPACCSGSAHPVSTWRRTRTSARSCSSTASRSGTTSGTRAATRSSPTASSTTRSPPCSGSSVLAIASIGAAALAFTLVVWHEWGAAGALLEPHVRGALAGHRPLGSVPVRARDGVRAARAQRAAARPPAPLRASCSSLTLLASPLAFLLLVLVLAGGALERPPRRATVAVIAAAVALRARAAPAVPRAGHFPFSLADLVPGARSSASSGSRSRSGSPARAASSASSRSSWRRCSSRSSCRAISARTSSASSSRRSRSRCSRRRSRRWRILARRAARRRRRLLEHLGARPHGSRGRLPTRATTASTGSPPIALPARPPQPVLPRRGRRHRRALAGRLPPGRGHPDRARLVPPERLPAERAALRPKRSAARAYRAWLRGLGVRYVVLTDAPPDYSSRAEAALIRSGRSGLVPVFRSLHVTVYELPDASPIVTGRCRRERSLAVADAPRLLGRRAGPLPRQGALVAVLAHVAGLRLAGQDGTVRVQARNAGPRRAAASTSTSRAGSRR